MRVELNITSNLESEDYTKMTWRERKSKRLKYIEYQKGLCCFCKTSLEKETENMIVKNSFINLKLFPKGFFNHPVHLHHCHKTGMTIGAVHNRCNAYLWQYKGE